MRAIQVRRFGGPEVLEMAVLPEPVPHKGELLVSVTGAGVNFADTHEAENSYLTGTELPYIPGSEVVGFVDGPGDVPRRVCGFVSRSGGYAEKALVTEALCFDVPANVTDSAALSLPVQGITAWHLVTTCARVQPGESVVVHAAAGGVGNLAVQLAKQAGAKVIATATTQDKLDIAAGVGADVGVLLTSDLTAHDVRHRLVDANGGEHVDVVFEMVGGHVFDGSLEAMAPFGRLVTYGMAGRVPPTPLSPSRLMVGSHSLIGFWLVDCLRPAYVTSMITEPLAELVAAVAAGVLRPVEGPIYPLAHAHRAHEDLRARRTTGKIVLDPRRDGTHA